MTRAGGTGVCLAGTCEVSTNPSFRADSLTDRYTDRIIDVVNLFTYIIHCLHFCGILGRVGSHQSGIETCDCIESNHQSVQITTIYLRVRDVCDRHKIGRPGVKVNQLHSLSTSDDDEGCTILKYTSQICSLFTSFIESSWKYLGGRGAR